MYRRRSDHGLQFSVGKSKQKSTPLVCYRGKLVRRQDRVSLVNVPSILEIRLSCRSNIPILSKRWENVDKVSPVLSPPSHPKCYSRPLHPLWSL
jgi:hypothetical protein